MKTLIICDIDNCLFNTIERILTIINSRFQTNYNYSDVIDPKIESLLTVGKPHLGFQTRMVWPILISTVEAEMKSIFTSPGLYKNLEPLPLLFDIKNLRDAYRNLSCNFPFLTNRPKELNIHNETRRALSEWNIKNPEVYFGGANHSKYEWYKKLIEYYAPGKDEVKIGIIEDHPGIAKEGLKLEETSSRKIKVRVFVPQCPWNKELYQNESKNLVYLPNILLGQHIKQFIL